MNLKFVRRVSERKRAISTICYRKKQINVSFSCVCPVIDNEFRHHIVKGKTHEPDVNLLNVHQIGPQYVFFLQLLSGPES